MEKIISESLYHQVKSLQKQLSIANETLEAIRTGQIDALVVKGHNGHVLYTLKSADLSYRIFIENMTEGAVTLSASGLILYCNSKFATMTNRPLSKVLGCSFMDFVAEVDKKNFTDAFAKAWNADAKMEMLLFSPSGDIPVQLSLAPLELEEGRSLSIIVTDLTAQKKTERELKQKNDQLEALNNALAKSNIDLQQFASVASHDLQEPLRKIQVFSKFLQNKNGTSELSETSKTYLQKILSSTERMRLLIQDILNYSRLSSDDMHFELVDLTTLVQDILDDFEVRINETNAKMNVGLLPTIKGNKGQIRQVFQNLISNSLKFIHPDTPPEITITEKEVSSKELGLSLVNERDFCRISVRDNGIGFDEKFVPSIFSLFEKLNPKARYEGSGIGLAIAKKIITKHHGFIVARSKEGDGAEFNVILPMKGHNYHVA